MRGVYVKYYIRAQKKVRTVCYIVFTRRKLLFLLVSFKDTYPCYTVNNQADKSPYICLLCFGILLLFEE